MHYSQLDTPALLIDEKTVRDNIARMQQFADRNGGALRPHTKTHKMSTLAKWQVEAGARGVTAAKVGEAEVMAQAGIDDIFIANQIVGQKKIERIRALSESVDISFGIDSLHHVEEIDSVFEGSGQKAQVVVEIEVGEKRSGVIEADDFKKLMEAIGSTDNVHFKGVFSTTGIHIRRRMPKPAGHFMRRAPTAPSVLHSLPGIWEWSPKLSASVPHRPSCSASIFRRASQKYGRAHTS